MIVDLMLLRLREQMSEHETGVELTQEAKELLVDKGYDPAMGARPLRRAIQRFIEDPLADFVLGRELTPGSTILVDRKRERGRGRHQGHSRPTAGAREGHRSARRAGRRGREHGRDRTARRDLASYKGGYAAGTRVDPADAASLEFADVDVPGAVHGDRHRDFQA